MRLTALLLCGAGVLVYAASKPSPSPLSGQRLAQQEEQRRPGEAVGLDVRANSTVPPVTGAQIVGNGGVAADVVVSGNGANSATGVRAIANGPGATSLRVIQNGPGTALRVQVGN